MVRFVDPGAGKGRGTEEHTFVIPVGKNRVGLWRGEKGYHGSYEVR